MLFYLKIVNYNHFLLTKDFFFLDPFFVSGSSGTNNFTVLVIAIGVLRSIYSYFLLSLFFYFLKIQKIIKIN